MPRKQTQAIIPKQPTALAPPALVEDLRQLITEARRTVAVTVNAGLTLLYWRIGKRVAEEVLGKERAAYGRQIVVSLSRQLMEEHGSSFGEKNLRRMIQFAEVFPEEEIVVSLIRQLSWTHFIALLPLKNSLQRDFYTELCRIEGWRVSTLRRKIDSMLFERTAVSRKPEKLARKELDALRADNRWTPDMVFRDPYILDFLQLIPRRESTGLIGRCSRSTSAQALCLSGRSRIKPIGILFSTRLPSDFRVVRKWSTHVSPGMRFSFFSQPRCRLCAIVSLLETALRSDSRTCRGLREAKLHGATLRAGIWKREIQ
jgi:hypothetical protein